MLRALACSRPQDAALRYRCIRGDPQRPEQRALPLSLANVPRLRGRPGACARNSLCPGADGRNGDSDERSGHCEGAAHRPSIIGCYEQRCDLAGPGAPIWCLPPVRRPAASAPSAIHAQALVGAVRLWPPHPCSTRISAARDDRPLSAAARPASGFRACMHACAQ